MKTKLVVKVEAERSTFSTLDAVIDELTAMRDRCGRWDQEIYWTRKSDITDNDHKVGYIRMIFTP